ncbi:MAG: T9SS type A sorting domain-containing protein, partial [Ignavibacteria bacterium]|nr:T9SS type A sorting domain-containing protein [Ignavibacteria bacterium]
GYYYLVVSYGNISARSNYGALVVMSKQPSSCLVSSRGRTSITLEWEYPLEGGGEGTLVVATRPNQYDPDVVPSDGRTYQANSEYGDNNRTIGTNHYVVYNGSGARVTVTNLSRGTYYRFRWFSYRRGNIYNPTYNTTTSSSNPRLINTLSKEASENFVYGETFGLSEVYPNPVEGSGIEFELYANEANNYEVRIFSAIGEEKFRSEYNLPEGSNIISIDVGAINNLPNGVYILQVSNGSEVLRRQFSVVR